MLTSNYCKEIKVLKINKGRIYGRGKRENPRNSWQGQSIKKQQRIFSHLQEFWIWMENWSKTKWLRFFVIGTCASYAKRIGKTTAQLDDKKCVSKCKVALVSHLMDSGSGYSDLCKLTSKMSIGAGLCNKRYYGYHEVICDETTNLSLKLEVLASECVGLHYRNIWVKCLSKYCYSVSKDIFSMKCLWTRYLPVQCLSVK